MSEITRDASGTASFTPPASLSADIYRLASEGSVQASTRRTEPFNSRDFSMSPANREGTEWDWTWTIRDTAGLNMVRGEIQYAYNRAASSDADTSYFQQATLPLAITEQTTSFVTTADVQYLVSPLNIFGRLAIGVRHIDGPIILAETSDTDPTLVKLTMAGGATHIINALAKVTVLNAATAATYMAVCKSAQPIELFSDLAAAPTSVGNMHANTAGAAGIVTTPFGNVIKAGSSYWFLPQASNYNAAPTEYNPSAVPQGGWSLGMKGVGNRPIRVYWACPDVSALNYFQSSSSSSFSSTLKHHLESTNIYGYDRQQFDMPGLRNVRQACEFRDGFIGTDDDNVTFVGRSERHIVPFSDRVINSDRSRKIVGFWPKGHDLFWGVEEVQVSTASPHDTRFWLEHYDWETDQTTQVTPAITRTGATGLQSYRATGAQAISDQTGYFHGRMGPNTSSTSRESWRYWRPEAGQSVYGTRAVEGAVIGTHPFHAATETNPITITLPETLFPSPITWARKTVTGYYFGGDLHYGEGCTVACSNAPSTTWRTGTLEVGPKEASRWHPVHDSNAGFLLPQPVITFWGGNIIYTSPQVYPITIQGKAYTDQHPKGFRDGA